MRSIVSGRRGLAGTVLVIVIVWALAAVLMLTGTLVSARRINDDVGIIRPEVSDIYTDTRFVNLAVKTERISAKISDAARPLTGLAADTLAAARRIDVTAKSILTRARSINGVAKSINNNVTSIGTTVGGIGSSFNGITSSVLQINATAGGIGTSARGINATARAVSDDVNSIRRRLGATLDHGQAIDVDVAAINRRAETIQRVGRSLGADLNTVREDLVPSIDRHANSIDCSTLVNAAGPTSGCRQTRGAAPRPRPRALARLLSRNGNGKAIRRAIRQLLLFGLVAPQRKESINVATDLAKPKRVPNNVRRPKRPGSSPGSAGAGVINRQPQAGREVGRAVGDGLDAFNGAADVVGQAQAEVVGRAINGLLSLG